MCSTSKEEGGTVVRRSCQVADVEVMWVIHVKAEGDAIGARATIIDLLEKFLRLLDLGSKYTHTHAGTASSVSWRVTHTHSKKLTTKTVCGETEDGGSLDISHRGYHVISATGDIT